MPAKKRPLLTKAKFDALAKRGNIDEVLKALSVFVKESGGRPRVAKPLTPAERKQRERSKAKSSDRVVKAKR
jgi:hypothetical protein